MKLNCPSPFLLALFWFWALFSFQCPAGEVLLPSVRSAGFSPSPFSSSSADPVDAFLALGPFSRSLDQPSTATLQEVFGRTDPAGAAADQLYWSGEHPRAWTLARAAPDGRLLPREAFGPAKLAENPPDAKTKQAPCVYLFRAIQSDRYRKLLLSVESEGPVGVWVNGKACGDSRGQAGWHGIVPVRAGPNELFLESLAPVRRATWFVRVRFLESARAGAPRGSVTSGVLEEIRSGILKRSEEFLNTHKDPGPAAPWPPGWLRLTMPCPRVENEKVEYTVFLPSYFVSPESRLPLLVVIPPVEEDAFYVALHENGLAAEARRRGWAIAVPELPTPFPLPGSTSVLVSPAEVLEALRADLQRRLPVDPLRTYLVGVQAGAEVVLPLAFGGSERYAGVALIEPSLCGSESWFRFPPEMKKRLPLFVAEGPALGAGGSFTLPPGSDAPFMRHVIVSGKRVEVFPALLGFFQLRAIETRPRRVLVVARSPAEAGEAWARVRQARSWQDPVRLSAEVKEENHIVVTSENVLEFSLRLSEMPMLASGKPLLIEIDGDVRRVIGQSLPESVSLSLTESEDPALWVVHEAQLGGEVPVEAPLGRLTGSWLPWSEPGKAGIGQLLAYAARKATGAQVAVLPARAARAGQAEGPVFLRDVTAWFTDAELSTVTVPTAALRRWLEQDFARGRKWVSDGVDAVYASGKAVDSSDGSSETLESRGVRESGIPGLFVSSALDSMGENVVVAGFEGWMENPEQWLGASSAAPTGRAVTPAAPASPPEAGFPPTPATGVPPSVGVAESLTLRQALLRLFEKEPGISPQPPDIRPLPRKLPAAVKEFPK